MFKGNFPGINNGRQIHLLVPFYQFARMDAKLTYRLTVDMNIKCFGTLSNEIFPVW